MIWQHCQSSGKSSQRRIPSRAIYFFIHWQESLSRHDRLVAQTSLELISKARRFAFQRSLAFPAFACAGKCGRCHLTAK